MPKRDVIGRASLRTRLLLGTIAWMLVTTALAGWGLGALFRQHVQSQFEAELRTHLDQLTAHIAVDAVGRPQLAVPLSEPRFQRPYSGYYWQVDADSAHALATPPRTQLRSRSLWDTALVAPADTLHQEALHIHEFEGPQGKRVVVLERSVLLDDDAEGQPGALRLLVGADVDLMNGPIDRFNGVLWLALALLAAGLALAAVLQVSVGLKPLQALRGALVRVRAGEAQQLEGPFPTEVRPLVDEFNTVLAHNAAVVERARTHAGNLAHALKTPLTVLGNAAQAPTLSTAELAQLVCEQVGVARRQVDYHLARAQAAAARAPGARTLLRPVLEGLVRVMQRIHAQRQLQILLQPWPTTLAFRGESQDLQEMLGNILDNACKWAVQRVQVRAVVRGALCTLTIDDDGPGLDPQHRLDVLRRGVRADEQVPGTGLGLAIVDGLARCYDGKLELLDSPLGGLRVALTLPMVS